MILLLLVLAATLNGANIVIAPGLDLFMTPSAFALVPLPPGFFAPGSDPFGGPMVLQGGPPLVASSPIIFTPAGPLTGGSLSQVVIPVATGGDTSVRRLGPANLPDGGSDTVPIELVALSLVSVNPITVTYNGGMNPEQWIVQMTVPGPQPMGSMTISRIGSSDGGTFTSQLPVRPQLIFTRVNPPVTLQVYLDFQDVLIAGGTWTLTNTTIPEPGTAGLMGAALIGLWWLRRRS